MMSGPIVRKYGFPNFEKIFGARAPQHGVDDLQEPAPAAPSNTTEDRSGMGPAADPRSDRDIRAGAEDDPIITRRE